ncbi:trove domain-containing protein [Chytridium lagenaria]|nr:trove domain-containing protein [Chytridium lagenaria]
MTVDTPQTQPLPGHEDTMVPNSAGGYSFAVDATTRLNRFLILGSQGGSYYATERQLTTENASVIRMMMDEGKGVHVVQAVLDVDAGNRAAKQDPSVLRLPCMAYEAVVKVCRIPTTLESVEVTMDPVDADVGVEVEKKQDVDVQGEKKDMKMRKKVKVSPEGKGKGFGRGMRRIISKWYNEREAKDLAYTVTKYKNRNGWTHADVMRLAHVQPASVAHDHVFRFITHGFSSIAPVTEDALVEQASMEVEMEKPVTEGTGFDAVVEDAVKTSRKKSKVKPEKKKQPRVYTSILPSDDKVLTDTLDFLTITDKVLKSTDETEVSSAILSHNLAREHIPSTLLNSLPVWDALLQNMPFTAMLRNLGKMTSIDLLKPLSPQSNHIVKCLTNPVKLRKSRIHPFNVLTALSQYRAGKGLKGSLSWTPNQEILSALNDAFYASFHNVEPTGKRHLLALDVSGSMGWTNINNSNITPRTAAGAMAMTFLRTEPRTYLTAFAGSFISIDDQISRHDSLEHVLSVVDKLSYSAIGTDCAVPMLHALRNRIEVDVFMVFTDSETYFGDVHPAEALRRYREEMGIDARLVVFGMVSNGFSIADPRDKGMLDVAGFDAAAPGIVREFSLGRI